MPWFMVDDGFHSHKKAVRAGAPALGLWVLAGSWCADQLTDGWIPDYIAARFDRDYEENARALVRAGLWREDEQEGEKGWQFHDWTQIQRTKDEVLEKRAEARERMRKLREKKKTGSPEVRANTSRSSEQVRSTPAHPSPAIEGSKEPSSSAAEPRKKERGTRIPDPFVVTADMVAWFRDNCTHVDGKHETQQFEDYWNSRTGQIAVKLDWPRTWKSWMRNAEKREAENAARRGVASDRQLAANDERCPQHSRQPANACGICASERNGAPRE